MKAVQLYNICWNNIQQKLFYKLFAFTAKLLLMAINPPPPHFLGAVSALAPRSYPANLQIKIYWESYKYKGWITVYILLMIICRTICE